MVLGDLLEDLLRTFRLDGRATVHRSSTGMNGGWLTAPSSLGVDLRGGAPYTAQPTEHPSHGVDEWSRPHGEPAERDSGPYMPDVMSVDMTAEAS